MVLPWAAVHGEIEKRWVVQRRQDIPGNGNDAGNQQPGENMQFTPGCSRKQLACCSKISQSGGAWENNGNQPFQQQPNSKRNGENRCPPSWTPLIGIETTKK